MEYSLIVQLYLPIADMTRRKKRERGDRGRREEKGLRKEIERERAVKDRACIHASKKERREPGEPT